MNKQKFKFTAFVIIVLSIILLVVAAATSDYTKKYLRGIYHSAGFYTKSAPLLARTSYKQELSQYDKQLTALSDKSYQASYSDHCENAKYNFIYQDSTPAYCKLTYYKLYFTNIPVCELLQKAKAILVTEKINRGGCDGVNPSGYNDATKDYPGVSGTTNIIVMDRNDAFGISFGLNISQYDDSKCYFIFCGSELGDSKNMLTILKSEKYKTAVLLYSSKNYYQE